MEKYAITAFAGFIVLMSALSVTSLVIADADAARKHEYRMAQLKCEQVEK